MNINISELEKKNQIRFKNFRILIKSLTHKSYDSINNNEKLEFLGDRVLGLVISKELLKIYPNEKVGVIDKKLASLVNKKKCLEVGKLIGLEKFILIRRPKNKNIKIEDKIISDCCEALIGALYIDQGFQVTEKFILKIWKNHLNDSIITFVDSKTKLQEYSLKKYKSLPIYKLISSSGPKHKPLFKISVRLKDTKIVEGIGNSKKNAEQAAAKLYLKNLNQ